MTAWDAGNQMPPVEGTFPGEDPVSPMAEAGMQYHVLFETLMESGFTEAQALRIIGNVLVEGALRREGDGGRT